MADAPISLNLQKPRWKFSPRLGDYIFFVKRCLKILGHEKGLFVLFILASLLFAFTEALGISLLVPVLQTIEGGGSFKAIPILGVISSFFEQYAYRERLMLAALIIGSVVVLNGLMRMALSAINIGIGLRVRQNLSIDIFKALMGASLSFIQQQKHGELLNAIINIPSDISGLIKSFGDIIWNFAVLIVYIVMMLIISVQQTIIVFVSLGILSLILNYSLNKGLSKAGKKKIESSSDLQHITHESLSGMQLVKLFVLQNKIINKFSVSITQFIKSQFVLQFLSDLPRPFMMMIGGLTICGLMFVLAYFSRSDDTSWLAPLIIFMAILLRLINPISAINAAKNKITASIYALKLYEKILLHSDIHREPVNGHEFYAFKESIRFLDVGFSYDGKEGNAVSNLSFEIKKNQTTALIGPSGAGKSTIAGLLIKFFEPDSGTIEVDGFSLKNLNTNDWRKKVVLVTQDTFLFDDTLRNNLLVASDEKMNDEVLWQMAELVEASEFIQNLPDGLDTRLGERGVCLSGGQRQRISLIRAILAKPQLLILDEATSQLDSITETSIQKTIETLKNHTTILVIAHRLSTVVHSDNIIVLKNGALIQQGDHEELLSDDHGLYAKMIRHQQIAV